MDPDTTEGLLLLPRSPLRCPFCHEDCHPHGAVVCQMCLGRHHAGCWDEHRACSSCGSQHKLVPETTVWQRSDEDLYELIRQGRREEVEDYVDRCKTYVDQVRERASQVATQLAFEKLTEELARRQHHRVVGTLPPQRAFQRRGTTALLAVLMGLAAVLLPGWAMAILALPLLFALGLKTAADRRELLVPNLIVSALAVVVCGLGLLQGESGVLTAAAVGAVGVGVGLLGWGSERSAPASPVPRVNSSSRIEVDLGETVRRRKVQKQLA